MKRHLLIRKVPPIGLGDWVSAQIVNPGAGVNFAFTCPVGLKFELVSVRYQLQTDATVSNRTANIVIDDGTNILSLTANNTLHTASQTVRYTAAPTLLTTVPLSNEATLPLGQPSLLMPGWRVRSNIGNFQAGDVLTNIFWVARRFDVGRQ